jgi:hypothetical protein
MKLIGCLAFDSNRFRLIPYLCRVDFATLVITFLVEALMEKCFIALIPN